MEMMNEYFGDRAKAIRGIKNTDSAMLDGHTMYHNHFGTNMGLNGHIPTETCGVKIEGNNRYLTLMQNTRREP